MRAKPELEPLTRKLQPGLSEHPVVSSSLAAFRRREAASLDKTATMAASSSDFLTSLGKGKSTRTLLRVIILGFIASAAIASRLFSVIRKLFALQHWSSALNAEPFGDALGSVITSFSQLFRAGH
jgi:hypothetical protein